jgi:O-antigen/teichoic acid export membrane protein
MSQVKNDSIINTFILYFGIVIGFVNKGILFPLLLTSSQVGLINVVILLGNYFAQLSNFGTGLIILRYQPFVKDRVQGELNLLLFCCFVLLSGIGILSVILFIFETPILSYFSTKSALLNSYSMWIIPLGISASFFQLFEQYLRSIAKNLVSVVFHEFSLRILILGLLSGLYLKWITFDFFVIFYFVIHFLPATALLFYLIKNGKLTLPNLENKLSSRFKKLILNYGFTVYINSFGRNIILMADVILLTSMKGLKEVGVFTIIVFISNALFVPYVSILRISSPLVPKLWKKKNLIEMNTLCNKVSSVGYFFTFVLFFIFWLNFDFFLSFLSKDYLNGKYIFLFLMMGRIFDAIGGLNGDILLTSKRYRLDVLLTIPLAILVVVFDLWLIPMYGGIGAAIGTCVVFVIYNLSRLFWNYKYFKLSPFKREFVTMIIYSVLIFVVATYINSFCDYLESLLLTILFLLIFIVPILNTKIEPELNKLFKEILKKLNIE